MHCRCFIALTLASAWLGVAQPGRAQGTIAYSQPASPIVLRDEFFGQFYSFDMDGDANSELTFGYDFHFVGVRNENGTRSLSFVNPPPDFYADPQPLPSGFLIGPESGSGQLQWFTSYPPPYNFNNLVTIVNTGTSGAFAGQHAYMGIEFQRASGTHYGWVSLYVDWFAPVAVIDSWAWETRPGVPILAGAVPEPSTCVLLVGGCVLVVWFRRKRNERRG
ncbi:MAG: PEP-CTERM sorting domain-containing protein [Verrucomicrobiota bacterium]|nr:PEP-CTERM sorting domain-containing protein [Verrucomicrobiota bacterium]